MVFRRFGDGNLEAAEARGWPCSGSAVTYERVVAAAFFAADAVRNRQEAGFVDRVEREERRLEGTDIEQQQR